MSLGLMACIVICLEELPGQYVSVAHMARAFAVSEARIVAALERLWADGALRVELMHGGDGQVASARLAPAVAEAAEAGRAQP
jgi:hypothetical protein